MKTPETVSWQTARHGKFSFAREIQVWRLPILPDYEMYHEHLSTDERSQAVALTSAEVRRVYMSSRVGMRRLFADFLQSEPAEVSLGKQVGGKPFIQSPPSTVEFNLSHSRDILLLAISNCGPVGVDVEVLRPVKNKAALARRVFSVDLQQQFEQDFGSDQVFLQCWTDFEAAQKLHGQGVFAEKYSSAANLYRFAPDNRHIATLAWLATSEKPEIVFQALELP